MNDMEKSLNKVKNVIMIVEPFAQALSVNECKIMLGMLADCYCTEKGIDNEDFIDDIAKAQKYANDICGKECRL